MFSAIRTSFISPNCPGSLAGRNPPRLPAQNADLSAAISDLQSRLQTLEQNTGARQLQEFESLLNECMAETDALKKGISSLCERLCCTLGAGFHPDESEQAALACAASRKG